MLGRLGVEAAVAAQQTAASGTSAWDTAARFTDQMIKNATQGYILYNQITGKAVAPPPAPTYAQSQTTASKLLLYGGLAVAAIALVMYMKKK